MITKEITCIVCPNSCSLRVVSDGGKVTVSGNRCPRGEKFGISEIVSPMRTITLTCATVFPDTPVLPCRTSCEVPKDLVFDVISEINKITVSNRLKRGDVIIHNVLGLGADVIATSDLSEEEILK